jgi:predicted secreted protein
VSGPDLTIAVGEEHVVRLEGHGSSGYRWEASVDGQSVVSVWMAMAEQSAIRSDTFSVDQLGIIRAIGPGNAVVRFRLRRSWESEPREERIVKVTVS